MREYRKPQTDQVEHYSPVLSFCINIPSTGGSFIATDAHPTLEIHFDRKGPPDV